MYRNNYNGIERFIEPNNEDYDIALQEIKNGHKDSHWIWYIFPQLKGLGISYMSDFYGIKDLNEAKEYLNHEILGKRLIEITESLLNLETNNAIQVFGYIDAVKVKSCMTLFYFASGEENKLFKNVLLKFYGGTYCLKTLNILKGNKEETQNRKKYNVNINENKTEDIKIEKDEKKNLENKEKDENIDIKKKDEKENGDIKNENENKIEENKNKDKTKSIGVKKEEEKENDKIKNENAKIKNKNIENKNEENKNEENKNEEGNENIHIIKKDEKENEKIKNENENEENKKEKDENIDIKKKDEKENGEIKNENENKIEENKKEKDENIDIKNEDEKENGEIKNENENKTKDMELEDENKN